MAKFGKRCWIKHGYQGSKFYYRDKLRHRIGGPAQEYGNGDTTWFVNDRLHRLDGPAIDWKHQKGWYIDGKEYTKEAFDIEVSKRAKDELQL